ncbi:hypothetical protein HYK08_005234 [Salmonella enterica]|nr:hypothetical protein [Salmonella enterica]EFR5930525.1 hypothetical protein [Salmonella enterica]EJF2679459.1 hypothetical protein [Salmonella enterica]
MRIEFQDAGYEARLIITGNLFEARKIDNLVDRVLFANPQLRAVQNGFFFREVFITGLQIYVLCAEALLEAEGFKVKEPGTER